MNPYIKDPKSFTFGITALLIIGSGIFIWKAEQRKDIRRYQLEFLIIRPCLAQTSNDEDYLKCVEDKENL
jgi:hypothetical protein